MVQYSITTRQKNGKWAYQIQIKDGDSWKYHSGKQGFEKKKDAIAAAQKVANGIEIQPEAAKDSFKAIADLYIASGTRSDSSIKSYNYWLKNFEPIFNKKITEVSSIDTEKLISDYYKTHSCNGTKCVRNLGNSIYRYAIKSLKIKCSNPFENVKVQLKSGKQAKEIRVLTINEIYDLIDKLIKSNKYEIAFLASLMGLCGLRISEARGVTRSSLNLNSRVVHVSKQRNAKGELKLTLKTANSKREVPLPNSLDKIIKVLPVPLHDNDLFVSQLFVTKQLKNAFLSCGYDIRPHELRHSFATNLIQGGIDFRTIAKLMGDTLETVLKTYSHVNDKMLDRAYKMISQF